MQPTRILALLALAVLIAQPGFSQESLRVADDSRPLSRVREGGTPYDAEQPLIPYAIDLSGRGLTGSNIASPPEYEPVKGVLYKYATNAWPSVVTALVAALTGDPQHDEIAYVVVTSTSQRNAATNAFAAAGADLSKVEFLIHPSNSIWMRDYGPHFIWEGDSLAIVDSHYYPTRPSDNFIPTLTGDQSFRFPTRDMGLYYSGGNFQPGPDRSAVVTALVNLDNPASQGFNPALIEELYDQFQGIDTLHVLPQLPQSVDGTGHIDMWMYMIDEDTVIISEFIPGSNATAIQITNNAVGYMESLGFTVHRPKAWNANGGVHYTYANAFRVNNRIFIPCYGNNLAPGGSSIYNDEDAEALAIWEAAAGPEIEIVPIQCSSIIPASGAIHCIVKQVPAYVGEQPAVNISRPSGGQLYLAGSTLPIEWSAIDTGNEPIDSVDISWSIDGGSSWNPIDSSTLPTGTYDWVPPGINSTEVQIRVVANGSDGDSSEAITAPFRIAPGSETTLDFSTGAGSIHRGFGFDTSSWSVVDSDERPVNNAVSTTNLGRMATSNNSRYVAPRPSGTRETTHVFEFQLDDPIESTDALRFHWEGYADRCSQCEMYVWDNLQQRWGDGNGQHGQNRYLDSWAGNSDGTLDGTLSADLDRYVDKEGLIRVLIYGERFNDETFHDYVSVTAINIANEFTAGSFSVVGGAVADGDLASLTDTDGDVLQLRPLPPGGDPATPLQLEIESTISQQSPSQLSFSIQSLVNVTNIRQSIELFNFVTGQYELLGDDDLEMSGAFVTVSESSDAGRFVQPKTGVVRARVGYYHDGPVLFYPWRIDIDRCAWTD